MSPARYSPKERIIARQPSRFERSHWTAELPNRSPDEPPVLDSSVEVDVPVDALAVSVVDALAPPVVAVFAAPVAVEPLAALDVVPSFRVDALADDERSLPVVDELLVSVVVPDAPPYRPDELVPDVDRVVEFDVEPADEAEDRLLEFDDADPPPVFDVPVVVEEVPAARFVDAELLEEWLALDVVVPDPPVDPVVVSLLRCVPELLPVAPADVRLLDVLVSDAEESSSSSDGQLLGSGIPSRRFAT